jgi:hypothetical protein
MSIQDLISGGKGGAPQWDLITTHEAGNRNGAQFVQAALESQLKKLKPSESQEFSAKLLEHIAVLLKVRTLSVLSQWFPMLAM